MLSFEQSVKIRRMQNQLPTIGLTQPHRLFHHPTSTTSPPIILIPPPFCDPPSQKTHKLYACLVWNPGPLLSYAEGCVNRVDEPAEAGFDRRVKKGPEKNRDSPRGTRRMTA